ncbi:ABC transporter permease [Cellulomonas sp. URHE0023]|uniref:ABC transporter permease n=1 Tax=Cellulomonas sp. URHE0023 TaxID=1380354 RepID=UPI0004867457|nr:anibiotic ABC transporter [Cellulomonas sp. URHE0023]
MTALADAPSRVEPRSGALSGTRALVRVALRLDRFRTIIWAASVGLLVLMSMNALNTRYATPESQQARATLISSPAATALAGPGYGLDDYTIGAMTANEIGLWIMIPVAIMALLAVTRHLRAAEEDGRLELVRSAPVGRDAPVVAGLVAAFVATLAVGLVTFAGLVAGGLEVTGSAALAGGVVMVGFVFAGVSAVASQLTAQARAASSLSMAVLGVTFLLRAVGDVRGPQSTSVLTWLSPFGWAQATAAYVDTRFWPLAIGLVVTAVLVGVAFVLVGRRDAGTGLLPERLGRPSASPRLTGMVALTSRRQLGAILSWGTGIVLMGGFVGLLAGALVDFIADEPSLADMFPTGPNGAAAGALALYTVFLAVTTGAYAATALGAARAEEVATRGAAVLALPVSRWRWLGSQAAVAGVASVLIMLVTGLVMGVTAASSLDGGVDVAELVGAAAVTLPAVGCMLGLAVLLVGLAPGAFGLIWAYVTYVFVVGLFGALLPDGADALSPFAYTPQLPAEPMDWAPVIVLTLVASSLVVAGLAAFRRRDVIG